MLYHFSVAFHLQAENLNVLKHINNHKIV